MIMTVRAQQLDSQAHKGSSSGSTAELFPGWDSDKNVIAKNSHRPGSWDVLRPATSCFHGRCWQPLFNEGERERARQA